MNCPLHNNEGAELILDYCSRKLDVDTTLTFEKHFAQCADCARVVDAQRTVWDALDSYEALPAISEDFDARLWSRIEASDARGWWHKLLDGPAMGWNSIFSWKPAMVTASACAAVFAVMMVVNPTGGTMRTGGDVPTVVEKAMFERTVDLDQVEGSIEDLDMLKQLGMVDDTNQPGAM